jgi:8-oxo-dGTP pyrophosphatase MutT (NUDIX family)
MEIEAPVPESAEEAIDELQARFLNFPRGEAPTVARVFMQIQQAHWYYEDEYADEYADSGLPHLSFTDFSKLTFERSPMLSEYCSLHGDFKQAFKEYMASIPKYGCILLNKAMTHVLLVCSFGGKSWSFPRGKVNQAEAGIDCAAREAYEETGFNPRHLLKESHSLTRAGEDAGSFIKYYIAIGVPDDGSFPFAPTTKKEVSEVGWASVADMTAHVAFGPAPNSDGTVLRKMKLWGVGEWLAPLRGFLAAQRGGKQGKRAKDWEREQREREQREQHARAKANGGSGGNNNRQRNSSTDYADALLNTGLEPSVLAASGAKGGASIDAPLSNVGRWSVKDMFKQNEKLLGVKFTYDGNPHAFGDYSHFGQKASSAVPKAGGVVVANKYVLEPADTHVTKVQQAAAQATNAAAVSSSGAKYQLLPPTDASPPAKPAANPSRKGKGVGAAAATGAASAGGAGKVGSSASSDSDPAAFRFDRDALFAAMGI